MIATTHSQIRRIRLIEDIPLQIQVEMMLQIKASLIDSIGSMHFTLFKLPSLVVFLLHLTYNDFFGIYNGKRKKRKTP